MKLKNMALLAAGSVALGTVAGIAGVAFTGSSALGTVVHYKVVERTFTVGSGHERVIDIKCPRGYLPVGGGAHFGSGGWPGATSGFNGVLESDLDLSHKGWASTVYVSPSSGNSSYTADAVCARWS